MENPRDGEKDILCPNSVFTIAVPPESRIIEDISCLKGLRGHLYKLNDEVAENWLKEANK